MCLLPLMTNAEEIESYTNSNGVVIPIDVYLDMHKMFPDVYIESITQDEYDELEDLEIDYDSATTQIKYFKTEINTVTGNVTNTEISELEYMQAGTNNGNEPQATVIETGYKKVSLSASKAGNGAYAALNAHWKVMPATRSFDVSAMRFQGATKINGSQNGKQFYTAGGTSSHVSYTANGTNINNQSNGFGISMNLVDNATAIDCFISTSLSVSSWPVIVNASYQHATTNVSLATSKSYTLSASGLGSTIAFTGNISSYYDGMGGVYQYIYN